MGLYETLQAQIDEMQDFTATEQTRADIKVVIRNYLWDDQRGLPESYGQPEVEAKADAVFAHMMMQARQGSGYAFASKQH